MRRSPAVLFLEPFVLLAVGIAAFLFLLSTKVRSARRNLGKVRGKGVLALQCCTVPCIAIAVIMPSIGPAALLVFFAIALVTILRMQ